MRAAGTTDDRALVPHPARLGHHGWTIDMHIGGQIKLIDHQQIRLHDSGTPLTRNIVALPDINHKHPPIHEIQREGRGKIVAATFDDDQVKIGESLFEIFGCSDVKGWVLANNRMWTRTGLDRPDLGGVNQATSFNAFSIFAGYKVIGDNRNVYASRCEGRQKSLDQGSLARPDRPADANTGRAAF